MKKCLHFHRLIALSFCVFAYLSANAAAKIIGNTLYLYQASDAQFEHIQDVDGWGGTTITKIVLDGNFTSGWSSGWLINAPESEPTAVETIDLSAAVMTGTASWSFDNFNNLKTIVWPTEGNITNIPTQAFNNCAIEEVHIPGYIQTIQQHAFNEPSNSHYLKKVYFDKWEGNDSNVQMHLDTQAFSNNYALTDVYILTEGTVTADNNAFPHWDTYGHADPNRMLATLHFPSDRASLYVNLSHKLSEATASDNKLFQEWLVAHYDLAGNAHNGFYEFVQSGDDDITEEPWGQTFLRTYSHATLDHIVPPGVKAYIVSDISSNTSTGVVTLTLKKVNVIPKATGVIVFGGANSTNAAGDPTLKMTVVNYDGTSFDINNNSGNKNYLTATANGGNEKTMLYPYEKDRFGNVYRSFIMLPFSKTESGAKYKQDHGNYGNGSGLTDGDWVGFFRAKQGLIDPNKAYLHLDENIYKDVDGGEIVINVTEQLSSSSTGLNGQYYRLEFKDTNLTAFTESELQAAGYWYKGKGGSKFEWKDKWGMREVASDFVCAKYNGELEDEEWMESLGQTTGIANVETSKDESGDYYTLQGVKVAQPQKGVYIKNGKKVVIK